MSSLAEIQYNRFSLRTFLTFMRAIIVAKFKSKIAQTRNQSHFPIMHPMITNDFGNRSNKSSTIRFSEVTEADSIVLISSDDSVIYVGTEKKQEGASYFGDKSDSSTDSSWSFQTPPNLIEKLRVSGRCIWTKMMKCL